MVIRPSHQSFLVGLPQGCSQQHQAGKSLVMQRAEVGVQKAGGVTEGLRAGESVKGVKHIQRAKAGVHQGESMTEDMGEKNTTWEEGGEVGGAR